LENVELASAKLETSNFLQGSPSLSASNAPIWLLGVEYSAKDKAEGMDQAVSVSCK